MNRLVFWLLMAAAFGIAVAILSGSRNRQDHKVAVGAAIVGVLLLGYMVLQGL